MAENANMSPKTYKMKSFAKKNKTVTHTKLFGKSKNCYEGCHFGSFYGNGASLKWFLITVQYHLIWK